MTNPFSSAATLAGLVLVTAALANDPLPATPGRSDVCPRIEQNYVLCSDDLSSPDCANLVDDVDALSALYRGELAQHPDWQESLGTSIWWGCGNARLLDLRSLLVRLASPAAKAALAKPPFANLDELTAPSDLDPPPSDTTQGSLEECQELPTPPQQSHCSNQIRLRVWAEHENRLTECRNQITGFLRAQLDASETAWMRNTQIECGAEGAGLPSASQRGLTLARCWARDTLERTRAMLEAHPECTPGAFDR